MIALLFRRSTVVASVVVFAMLAGIGALVWANSSRSASAESDGSTARLGQVDPIRSSDPPCGVATQRLLTLEQAQDQLGPKLLLPSEANASAANLKVVAICSRPVEALQLVVVFDNGVWIDESPTYGHRLHPHKAVADDPNESRLGHVNGTPVYEITPAQGNFPRRGAVYLSIGNRDVVVVGNTVLSVDELEAIAASIPGAGQG